MTYTEASNIIFKACKAYDPLIDKIGDELLQEAGGRIPVLQHRNPSLFLGSANFRWIIAFGKNPDTFVVESSALSIKACNGD